MHLSLRANCYRSFTTVDMLIGKLSVCLIPRQVCMERCQPKVLLVFQILPCSFGGQLHAGDSIASYISSTKAPEIVLLGS